MKRRVFHENYHEMLDDVLRRHPRLHVDISWACREEVLQESGGVTEGWIRLIEEFPERFLLGSDMVGHYEELGKTISSFAPLLEALSSAAREKVSSSNAERLFFSGSES